MSEQNLVEIVNLSEHQGEYKAVQLYTLNLILRSNL